jgi:hypothetical protein
VTGASRPLAECVPSVGAVAIAGIAAVTGTMVRCPAAGCGAAALIEESKPTGVTKTAAHPRWRIVNCQRCGKTQYRSDVLVEVLSDPPPPVEPVAEDPPLLAAARRASSSASWKGHKPGR